MLLRIEKCICFEYLYNDWVLRASIQANCPLDLPYYNPPLNQYLRWTPWTMLISSNSLSQASVQTYIDPCRATIQYTRGIWKVRVRVLQVYKNIEFTVSKYTFSSISIIGQSLDLKVYVEPSTSQHLSLKLIYGNHISSDETTFCSVHADFLLRPKNMSVSGNGLKRNW